MLRFITSPSKLGLAIILFALGAIGILLPERTTAAKSEPVSVTEPVMPIIIEETVPAVEAVPAIEVDAKTIGQLAQGMRRIKERRDRGQWYFCGEELSAERQVEISTAIAYHIMINLQSVALEDVSPWGIVATAYNESGFDACSLGSGPRRWAYREGLLEPRVTSISHTMDEVMTVVTNPKARKIYKISGFDLGLCQILTRFYPGNEKEMLSLDGGARHCVLEMQARSRAHDTVTPWLFWRGPSLGWYQAKIRRWVRIMGPIEREII